MSGVFAWSFWASPSYRSLKGEAVSMHGCQVRQDLVVQTIKHFPENSASLLKQHNIKEKEKNSHGNWGEASA